MKYRPLSDSECALIIEEDKRLCEKDVLYVKGIITEGVTIYNGETAKKNMTIPAIKLGRKISDRRLYEDTVSISEWKMVTDKEKKILTAFLSIEFPLTHAPKLIFCFEMNMRFNIVDLPIIKKDNMIGIPVAFDEHTDNILQWMNLLIQNDKGQGSQLAILDGDEPSIGSDGIPIDVPIIIMQIFEEIIRKGDIRDDNFILVLDKDNLKAEKL